jgi:glycosyltransferase involved in cell wall biosynthesis
MRISFYSNFLNHHQLPFCLEMKNLIGNQFTFISTEPTPDSFLQSGYPNCEKVDFNLLAYSTNQNMKTAIQLGLESDVVMIGSAPEYYVKERISNNKLTFRVSERIFKRGYQSLLSPRALFHLYKQHTRYRNRNVHMLCASSFASYDFKLINSYTNKMYKWGYFTEIIQYDIKKILYDKPHEIPVLLWVGRFINWKHPELAVQLAEILKRGGLKFQLKMIGSGPLIQETSNLIKLLDVQDYVELLGNKSNDEVRNIMLKANIFLLTSDRNEGWGAVLNEAMSSGCAVLGSNMIGSVPYLIEHERNGLIFKSMDLNSLTNEALKVISNEIFRNKLAESAYHTMIRHWNPRNAAYSFVELASSLLNGEQPAIKGYGPCSIA